MACARRGPAARRPTRDACTKCVERVVCGTLVVSAGLVVSHACSPPREVDCMHTCDFIHTYLDCV